MKHKTVVKRGKDGDKEYDFEVRQIKPDHLALLMDEKGAFAIKDGGGVLANKAGPVDLRSAVTANELSFGDITSQLREALASKVGEPGKMWYGYITEVYGEGSSGYAIFCEPSDSGYQKITYEVKKDEVKLTGEPVKVERQVSYVTANAAGDDQPEKETTIMAFDKAKCVDGLIANGSFEKGQKDELMKLPDAILEGFEKTAAKALTAATPLTTNAAGAGASGAATDAGGTTAPALTTPQAQKALTFDDILANSDPATQKMLTRMKSSFLRSRNKSIETIKKASNKFSDTVLANMDDEALEALSEELSARNSSVEPFGGFFGQAGTVVANAAGGDEEKPLGMPNYSSASK